MKTPHLLRGVGTTGMKDGGSDRAFATTVQRDAETQALEINESREQLPSTGTVRNMNLIIKI